MARTARPPCPVACTATLRLELLDARCVPSATVSDQFQLTDPAWSPAHIAPSENETAALHGPLLVMPAEVCLGREVTVDWGDGIITTGVLLPGLKDEMEVWSKREAAPGTVFQLTITMTDATDSGEKPLVYQTEFVSSAETTPGIDSEIPPPAPPPPTPTDPKPDPVPVPGGIVAPPPPAGTPVIPRLAPPHVLLPPRSESPFRAGEVQSLAALAQSLRTSPTLKPVAGPITNLLPSGEAAGGGISGLSDEEALQADVSTASWEFVHQPITVEAVGDVPVADGCERGTVPVEDALLAFPLLVRWEPILLEPVNVSVTSPTSASELLIALAANPAPSAVFARDESEPPEPRSHRSSYLARGIAMLVGVVVSYRTFVPRLHRAGIDAGRHFELRKRDGEDEGDRKEGHRRDKS